MDISTNLRTVRERIDNAARRSGRNASDVSLIAVSKTVDSAAIKQMVNCGHSTFGENRPQCIRDKSRELAGEKISWHLIGTLQTNKIRYVYPLVELIHSVDRIELLKEFENWAVKTKRRCPCLLEVHISDEESKHGFDISEVTEVIASFNNCENLDIRGLMGMAPFTDDEKAIRTSFRKLRDLFDKSMKLCGKSYKAEILSMGMSDDFEIAIEEGSTMVRIGRALFT
ncbi:MAG: YggS family pyridoxal phosphate-dependent enzyme [Candidatus Riflebacteria bacterium]|nr:YggS family pyridoxal phosphate-dependent enzyme [Candidatus Riflebacteria bacterium]